MGFSSALLSLAALALARGAVAPRRTVPAGRVRAASAASPRPRYDKTPAELFEKAFAPYYIPPTVANARPDLVQKYQPESLSKVRGGRAKIRPKRMVVYVDGAKRYQRPPAGEWRRVAVAPKPVAPVEPKSKDADYYWKQAPIHNWGNTGFRGRMHAFLSPLATAIIDRTSYGGRDVRHEILKQIKGDGTVLDLCCGTGFSTAPGAVGVDATEEMVDVARFWHPGKLFRVGNAESYGEPFSFDVVTVMFATHEMPQAARRRVLRNAARIARKYVLIADIDPKYKLLLLQDPLRKAQATAFLAGEPYVPSYLKGMQEDVESVVNMRGGWSLSTFEQMTGHVKCWKLERANVLEGRPGAGPEPERFGV